VQVALISPFGLMMEMPNTRYHLVLAHLLHHHPYRDFYQQIDGWKILDNGAAEGSLVSSYELCEYARNLQVDEVVVPDALMDCDKTLALARGFRPYAIQYPLPSYIGVVQGRTAAELLKCLRGLYALDYMKVFALPRSLLQIDPIERIWFATKVRDIVEDPDVEIHCLGAGANVREPQTLARQGYVRGMDTSYPIYMGLMGFDIKKSEYFRRPPDYFRLDYNEEQLEQVQQNVATYLGWCDYGV